MTSNIQDIDGVSPMISPDARQSFLLSSNTVLRFSIQTASTGPSKMIHFRAGDSDVDSSLKEAKKKLQWDLTGSKTFLILPKYERHNAINPFVSYRIKLTE
jgi:hypothetical protein